MKLQCWKCGETLKDVILPFSRREECSVCKADQHVCMLCKEYDPTVSNACREDRADFILEKEKANFCDYFKPRPNAYQREDQHAAAEARAKLADLFGEVPEETESESDKNPALSKQEKALEELKKLFGDN